MEEPTPRSIDQKLDELIALLSTARLSSEATKKIQEKFNNAIEGTEGFQRIKQKDIPGPFSNKYKLDSRAVRRDNMGKMVIKISRMIVAALLVGLGWGMIIMPAPPYFEMFTLFYLSKNDGVTIMDVISLIVALTGISLFISTLIKFK